ncbi:MAG: hypothetical protein K0R98_954 [Rickettsiaceae bacterium]|jgi:hypothetical protein|nr:hypothetical protein [Rickettsiaceae bacterium]
MTSVSLLTSILQDYQSTVTASGSPAVNTTPKGGDAAYLLDLSQAAQSILNSQSANPGIINLTGAQKDKLSSILEKYKDSPISEDTLSSLYADLKQAGLVPEQLAEIQEAIEFSPSEVFLQLLGSNETNADISPVDGALSGLSSAATGTPIGDLLQQYASSNEIISPSSDIIV